MAFLHPCYMALREVDAICRDVPDEGPFQKSISEGNMRWSLHRRSCDLQLEDFAILVWKSVIVNKTQLDNI